MNIEGFDLKLSDEMIRAFDQAFRGCGTDLDQICRSNALGHETLTSLMQHTFAPDELRDLTFDGPLVTGVKLNNHNEESEPEIAIAKQPWDFNPAHLGLLSTFADHLKLSVNSCLPEVITEEMLQPEGKSRYGNIELPVYLDDLVAEWRFGGAEQQIEIARMICNLFYTEGMDGSYEHYTPMSRVLPHFFGTWDGKDSHSANCLGKSMMAAAFFWRTGARVYAAAPILDFRLGGSLMDSQMAMDAMSFFAYTGLPITYELLGSMKQISMHGSKIALMQNFPHMALLVELIDGRWVMVDCNYNLISVEVLPDLADAWSMLSGVNSFFGSMGLFLNAANQLCEYYDHAEETRVVLLNSSRLMKPVNWDVCPPKQTIANLFAQTPLIDELLKNPELRRLLPKYASREKIARELISLAGNGDKAKWLDVVLGDESASVIGRIPRCKLSSRESAETLAKIFYLFHAKTNLERQEMESQAITEMKCLHHATQITLPWTGFAPWVLAHTAHALEEGVCYQMERFLGQYCFDYWRLYANASAPFHIEDADQEFALQSAEALATLKLLHPSALEILDEWGLDSNDIIIKSLLHYTADEVEAYYSTNQQDNNE